MDESQNKKLMKKVLLVTSLSGPLLFFFVFIIIIIVVFFILGLLNNTPSGKSYCVGTPNGDISALFDNSITLSQFTSIVNSYDAPDNINEKTGKSTKWGYEIFFKANASNFYNISTKYGLDPRFIFALGIEESYWGTSRIALDKGNFFGWNAVDNNPYNGATKFYDMAEGIETVSKGLKKGYIDESGWQHQKIKNAGREPTTLKGIFYMYSTAQDAEAEDVANIMQKIFGVTVSSSACNGNFKPLTTYTLENEGLNRLTTKLSDEQRESLNSFITREVNSAGYGTGAAVATAGQSLIYGMEQFGLYLPYYWGGGHYDNASIVGVSHTIGDKGYSCNSARCYYTQSFDCSGYVSWSIRNGCKSDFETLQSGNFMDLGDGIDISSAKPGDILSKDGHVMLVIKNNGDGTIIIGESTGGSDQGHIWFKTLSSAGKYKVVDMTNWYAKNCDKSRVGG